MKDALFAQAAKHVFLKGLQIRLRRREDDHIKRPAIGFNTRKREPEISLGSGFDIVDTFEFRTKPQEENLGAASRDRPEQLPDHVKLVVGLLRLHQIAHHDHHIPVGQIVGGTGQQCREMGTRAGIEGRGDQVAKAHIA